MHCPARHVACLTSTFMVTGLLSFAALAADVEVQLGPGDSFVVKDETGTVERLRVEEATGDVSRNGLLFIHSAGGVGSLFVGDGAGNPAATGGGNVGFGQGALGFVTSGVANTATGRLAMGSTTTGDQNTAFGAGALGANVTGSRNLAIGHEALLNAEGNDNLAIGFFAGLLQTTGSNNVYIANRGVAAENGQIKIGTIGTHTATALVGDVTVDDSDADGDAVLNLRATSPAPRDLRIGVNQASGGFISMQTDDDIDIRTNGVRRFRVKADGTIDSSGISGHTVSGVNVLINTSSDELGIAVSSARFKRDIYGLSEASETLYALRPVSFRYREGGPDAALEYGLIAEEVAETAPDLVVYDETGAPYAVRYQMLAPMLVSEVQRLATRVAELEARLATPEPAR